MSETYSHIDWRGDALRLLDQRELPAAEVYVTCTTALQVAAAIRDMVVRGAPAIGITAAYGAVLAARCALQAHGRIDLRLVAGDMRELADARPTAVNLSWALAYMAQRIGSGGADELLVSLEQQARDIQARDIAANRRMGELGAALLASGAVITHCNTGTLATGGYGTALGVIRTGVAQGKIGRVLASETRPWLQGARLTAWELSREEIDVTLICEGSVGSAMCTFHPGWAIVGADRIAANGDAVNKIGTYNLAVLARQHGARTMVVAPTSSIDAHAPSGAHIEIEMRAADEVLAAAGYRQVPAHVQVWNPVFDVTPASLIDAIVTERGVASPPSAAAIAELLD
ncbi:MAG: S-methyl-5-thioribose-1-phosphate isomerase [Gammaproteobacteria bacterium]|nr:S-methyl-5-thioribose-1-phosphate isomerase [Gammaproteobacteria bacterium]